LRGALLQVQRQFGHGGGGIAARSMGVVPAWLAMPTTSPL
jgi:hypothetical protein